MRRHMCPHCEPDGLRLPVDELPPKCRAHETSAGDERRIIVRLRRRAHAHERLARILVAYHGGGLRTEAYHEGAADALETMADRIERGDA